MVRTTFGLVFAVLGIAAALSGTHEANAAETPWVNDLAYGSAGGGFYWDTASGQVWTAERSWHMFSPVPDHEHLPLWADHSKYGSAGGGFYWDPVSNQVWTAERGWHSFDPRPAGVPPPPPPPPNSGAKTFGEGTFIVGQDISAGTYRTRIASDGCYWERLSGFSGDLSDVIANDFTDSVSVVTISATDKGFTSSDCGTWTSDLSGITPSVTSPFADGTFIVGTDVAAGTWRSAGGSSCYWERLEGFSGKLDDLAANDFGTVNPVVTISPADKGFNSSKCGTWTKIG